MSGKLLNWFIQCFPAVQYLHLYFWVWGHQNGLIDSFLDFSQRCNLIWLFYLRSALQDSPTLISEFNGFSEKRKTAYGGFQSALLSFNVPLIGKPCCTYCFTGDDQHLMILNQEQHKGKGRCSNKWYLYRIATCRTEQRHFKMWSLQLWSSATSSHNWPPWYPSKVKWQSGLTI